MRGTRIIKLMIISLILGVCLAGADLQAKQAGPDISGEEIYGWAQAQCEFGPRRPGTEAMDRARDHIIGLLEGWGYDVRTEAITFTQYFPQEWSLEVVSPEKRTLESFPMWHSGSTGPEGLEADLVYVRKGGKRAFSEKDVAGKVVLVSWGYRIINLIAIASLYPSYDRAMENGAGGYIQFFTNTPGNAFQLTDAGSLLGEADAGANTLPGLSIGKEDARYLKALLEKGEVRVRMTLKGQDRETDTYTIMAMLPGRTDDIILIDTHYCSIFTGAFDNATGVASSLALARYFSEIPESERDKTLLFNFYGSHEYAGCNVGANKFYKRHPELIEKLVIDIGLDHMAAYPWKEYFGHMTRIRPWTPVPGMDQPRGVFISENPALYSIVFPAIFKYRLIPFLVFPNKLMAMCETGVLYNQGIAALRITQCPPWYHTPLDTMDKFSPSQLKRAVDAHIEIVEKIDRIPADRFRKMDINLGPAIDGCGGIAPEQGMKGNLIHKIMTKDKNKNP